MEERGAAGERRAPRANYFITKRSRIATRNAKMPRPSASAAPMKARPNCASEADGLRNAPARKRSEDLADADGGGAHADGGEAGTDVLGCGGIHA